MSEKTRERKLREGEREKERESLASVNNLCLGAARLSFWPVELPGS